MYLKLSKFKSYVFFIQYRMWKWATWCQGRSLDDSCCRCKYRQPVLLMLCCGFKKSEIHCLNEMRCHETRSLTCFSVLRNCLLMLYGLNYESAQDFDFGSWFEEKWWAGGGGFNSKGRKHCRQKAACPSEDCSRDCVMVGVSLRSPILVSFCTAVRENMLDLWNICKVKVNYFVTVFFNVGKCAI